MSINTFYIFNHLLIYSDFFFYYQEGDDMTEMGDGIDADDWMNVSSFYDIIHIIHVP